MKKTLTEQLVERGVIAAPVAQEKVSESEQNAMELAHLIHYHTCKYSHIDYCDFMIHLEWKSPTRVRYLSMAREMLKFADYATVSCVVGCIQK